MARNRVYRITLPNWKKHNPSAKKLYKKTLIDNNFCSDAKLNSLPVSVRWMFLNILLTCGNHARDTVEMSERQLRDSLESSWSIERALTSLQSFQLVTFEKMDFLIKGKERKGKERNTTRDLSLVKERDETSKKQAPSKPKPSAKKESTEESSHAKALRERVRKQFKSSYQARYGFEPVTNAKFHSCIKQLCIRLGEEAIDVVKFFLANQKPFYVEKGHDVSLLLKDAEALRTQMRVSASEGVKSIEKLVAKFIGTDPEKLSPKVKTNLVKIHNHFGSVDGFIAWGNQIIQKENLKSMPPESRMVYKLKCLEGECRL